jgi:hypothetical protein
MKYLLIVLLALCMREGFATCRTGPQGPTGATGATGPAGVTGSTGITVVTGTTNQVISSTVGSVVTLSLPQNVDKAATPIFGAITTTDLMDATYSSTVASRYTAGILRTNGAVAGSGTGHLVPAQPDALNTGATLTKVGQILRHSASGNDSDIVESPFVFFDDVTHLWYMTYTGYRGSGTNGAIMLASSPDMSSWTKLGAIMTGSGIGGTPDVGGCTAGTLTLIGSTYYLYYSGLGGTGYEQTPVQLCLATASSVTGPYTRYLASYPVIAPAGGNSVWYSDAIFTRTFVTVNSTYYMFFNAAGYVPAAGVLQERVGYATSTDFITWTINNTPILTDAGATQSWESSARVGDPSIYRVGSFYVMAYYSVDGGGTGRNGLAYTSAANFPTGWTRWTAVNPVLTVGTDYNSWDGTHAHKPMIVYSHGNIYHYYTSVAPWGERSISLAMQTPNGAKTSQRADSIAVTRSTTQTFVDTGTQVTTPLSFDAIRWTDTGTFLWDGATSITVLKSGIYNVNLYASIDNTASSTGLRALVVQVNGGNVWGQDVDNNPKLVSRMHVLVTLALNNGDILTSFAYQNSGSTLHLVEASEAGLIEGDLYMAVTRIGH